MKVGAYEQIAATFGSVGLQPRSGRPWTAIVINRILRVHGYMCKSTSPKVREWASLGRVTLSFMVPSCFALLHS